MWACQKWPNVALACRLHFVDEIVHELLVFALVPVDAALRLLLQRAAMACLCILRGDKTL